MARYQFDAGSGLITRGAAAPARRSARASAFQGTGGGFDGARNDSLMRSGIWYYLPTADTRHDVDSYSRHELMRKSAWLYNNMGFPRRLINGATRYAVGKGIVPFATTADADWNVRAEAYFDDWARSPEIFDIAGKWDFYSSQTFMARSMFKLGGAFAIKSKSPNGRVPQMQFFEGHLVGPKDAHAQQERWHDGIRTTALGRPTHYHFLRGKGTTVEASRVCHVWDPERGGAVHGVPWLYHALTKLQDKREIEAAADYGVKLDQMVAMVMKSDGGAQIGYDAAATLAEQNSEDAPTRTHSLTLQDLFSPGMIPELNTGESLDSFRGENPSQRLESWVQHMTRDCAWGFGMSPELAWNIAGVGGAPMRWILEDGQRFFEEVQRVLCLRYIRQVWRYRIAWGIRAGDLPLPAGGRWWEFSTIEPQKVTVDRGRDGKLEMDLIRAGLQSLPRYYRALGLDWQDELSAQMDALQWIKAQAGARGLEIGEVLGPAPGAAGHSSGTDDNADDDDDNDNDDEEDEDDEEDDDEQSEDENE